MSALEITIQEAFWQQQSAGARRPVVVAVLRLPGQLPRRVQSSLGLTEQRLLALRAAEQRPDLYGRLLGRALFSPSLSALLAAGREALAGDPLHVQLVVEDRRLQALFWEWLAIPIAPGRWRPLAQIDALPFARALPSPAGNRFRPRQRRDQRALLLLANPPAGWDPAFPTFDEGGVAADLRAALQDIPVDVLGHLDGAVGPPTLDALCYQLRVGRYTLLHIAAHGSFNRSRGEAGLLLADAADRFRPVHGQALLDRLSEIADLPHCVFLTACESAGRSDRVPGAALAQQLVEDLGIPAVVAMVQTVSMNTANQLAARFFSQLREDGYPDQALTTARSALATRYDALVPALFSRLEDRPLFPVAADVPLTLEEIDHGLALLQRTMDTRAPAHRQTLRVPADHLRAYVSPALRAADPDAAVRWIEARAAVEQLAETVAGVSFRNLDTLTLPEERPAACPFPGLQPLSAGAAGACYGRESVLADLLARLATTRRLVLSGPSGSGKTSLLQAGLLPRLGDRPVFLTTPAAAVDPALLQAPAPLLIVDQFEALWTQLPPATLNDYAHYLASLPDRVQLLLVVDESFVPNWKATPALAPLLAAPRLTLEPLAHEFLREVLERQAAAAGLRFEEGLALRMAADLAGEPAAPALLQLLLARLWERRFGPWLRHADYAAIGGAAGVVVEHAETFWSANGLALAPLCRALPRLAQFDGDPARATARTLARDDLAVGALTPAETGRQVHQLTTARLLVAALDPVDRCVRVSIAHEALLRRWPRFQQWLHEDLSFLERWQSLHDQLTDWRAAGKSAAALPRGAALRAAAALVAEQRAALTSAEIAFVETAAAAAAAEEARRQAALRSGAAVRGFLVGALAYGIATAVGRGDGLLHGGSYDLFVSLNQALYGGFAALAVFLLLDPHLLGAVQQPTFKDHLRAALGAGLPLAALFVAELLIAATLQLAILLPLAIALLCGLVCGGAIGSGLLWRAVGNRPLWPLLPIPLLCGALLAAADKVFDILPLTDGPWPLLWPAYSLFPLALILAAGLKAHDGTETDG